MSAESPAPPLPGGPLCPLRTAHLPAIGGRLDDGLDAFVVDEVPAYAPSGEGEHHFVHIRKRGLSTPEAVDIIARAAGCDRRAIGYAGRKDKHATTTQWLSLPVAPVAPDDDRIEVLTTARHGRKLRLGHLWGNRFTLRVVGAEDAAARLPALIEAIERGIPNYYGPQRFGRRGLAEALAFAAAPKRRVRDPKFLASVLQSAVFNHWLGARVADERFDRAVEGEVLRKRDTGGVFVSGDFAEDDARVAAGAVDPMGPMPGPKLMAAQGEAAAREEAAAAAYGTDLSLTPLGRWAPGVRRLARVVPEGLEAAVEGEALVVRFALPSGCYATTVLAELCGGETSAG